MHAPEMRPPFRLLVTGSRTWDDPCTIGQALAVILVRHPADAIAAAYAARPATRSRRIRPTGTATAGPPVTAATPR